MQTDRKRWILWLAYIGFISLGLPDSVMGVAWPSIRHTFSQPLDALGPYFIVATAGYVFASFQSGPAVRRLGVGLILAYSSLLTTLSLLGYALAPSWTFMVAVSFIAGIGAGAIDSGINTYAAVRFTPRHVNWLHACWGIGAATGPAIMTAVLGTGASWRGGYLTVMLILLALTAGFFATSKQWTLTPSADTPHPTHAPRRRTLTLPATWMSIGIFFIYCGIESSAGQWSYSLLVESRHISSVTAGMWISLYWGALTAGRFIIGAGANHIPPLLLLRLCMTGAIIGTGLLFLQVGHGLEAFSLALIGFSLAPIFPTLIALTPRRFAPDHVPNVVGLQVAGASLGIALIPPFIGLLAEKTSLEILPPVLMAAGGLMLLLHEAVARRSPTGS